LLIGSWLNVPGSFPLGSALNGSLPLGMALGGLDRLPLGTARYGYGCSSLGLELDCFGSLPFGMALRRLAARLGARWPKQLATWLGA
jgi:hypothetical protein